MRVVLLANGWVGREVAAYLGAVDPPVGVVVHEPPAAELAQEIVDASGVGTDDVIASHALHEPEPLRRLQDWAPDIVVAAWYGSILRPDVVALPPRGCINLHPSYLPLNRGKFPNVWSIVERTTAGATVHYIDDGIDTGDVILRRAVAVDPTDTGASLYAKLQRECVDVFREAWPQIREGTAPRTPQSELPEEPSFHRARDVDGIDEIDPDATYVARDLIDLLRARTFRPHPSAYIVDGGRRIDVRVDLSEEP